MIRVKREQSDWIGITASAVGGLVAGVVAGIVLVELLGNLDRARVHGAFGRLRKQTNPPEDLRVVQAAIDAALASDDATASLDVKGQALGDGVVELTGTVQAGHEAQRARTVVEQVPGVSVLVNHVLVEGEDIPVRDASAH